MARARNIKPGFFKNEILGTADPLYSILFEGLWVLADREGRLEDRPLRIKAEIFPYREGLDMDGMLSWLQSNEFILRYQVDGKRFIQVLNFIKHQNPHKNETASEIPGPEKADKAPEKIGTTSEKIGSAHADSLYSDSINLIPDSLLEKPVASEPRQQPDENPVLRILEHWKTTMGHPRTALDAKREKAIKGALKLGYSEADICQAITGCSLTPHNMGQNEQGQRYDGLHIILRDADQIDRFIRNALDPPKPKTQADMRTQAKTQGGKQNDDFDSRTYGSTPLDEISWLTGS